VVGWDEGKYQRLFQTFADHPWRLPKKVKHVFDCLAAQISQFLHPHRNSHPKAISNVGEFQFLAAKSTL